MKKPVQKRHIDVYLIKKALYITVVSLFSLSSLYAIQAYGESKLPETLRFKKIMQEPEPSVGEILAFYQDSAGFMWIGGRLGLARYDGDEYVIYRPDSSNPESISSNNINDILGDDEGNLWIATDAGLNRYDYANDKFIRYTHNPDDISSINANSVYRLHIDHQQQLWLTSKEGLATYNNQSDDFTRYPRNDQEKALYTQYTLDIADKEDGVYYISTGFGLKIWNSKTGEIKRFQQEPEKEGGLPHNILRSILVDSKQRIWVGSDKGLLQYLPSTESFKFYPTEIDRNTTANGISVWDVFEDSQGTIWAAYDGQGISYLDESTGMLMTSVHNELDSSSLSSSIMRRINEDRAGDVWIGAYPFGINVFERYTAAFNVKKKVADDNTSMSKSAVRSFWEEENGDLWLGTDGGGLNYYDKSEGTYTVYKNIPDDKTSLGSNEILSILKAKDGKIWAGTWNSGINILDPSTGKFEHIYATPGDSKDLENIHSWKIIQDHKDRIWIASIGGGVDRYDARTNTFINYHHLDEEKYSIADDSIWALYEDSNNTLWAGTHSGLSRYRPDTDDFISYSSNPEDPKSLSASRVQSIYEDSTGRMWIGTNGGGLNLFDRENETFSSIQVKDGLISNIINAILEDDEGNIWMSTNKGLSVYTPETATIYNFTDQNGVQQGEFNIGTAIKLKNRQLIFGGVEGYTKFNPKDVKTNDYIPPVAITDIKVLNKSVTIGAEGSPLEKSILLTKQLKFNYLQNIFSFSFSSLSFRDPKKNQYAFMLEGFDKGWQYVGSKRNATYTNLNAGTYVFRVKAANSAGVWNEEGQSITIKVTPPPWKTWWAYTLYVMAVMLIIGWYFYTQRKMLLHERQVVRRLKKVDKIKDEFLANTSHELRTPLFGIIGLAEGMIEKGTNSFQKGDIHNLSMIVASGKRLSTIVEDVLDFSRIRNNSLSLSAKPVDIRVVSDVVVALSVPMMDQEKVSIKNNIAPDTPLVHADEDRLQQILYNLIGNAIKFTAEGQINVDANIENDMCQISIKDTGIGIPPDKISDLFKSFTQVEDSDTRTQGGTGLGLAITQNLVELHHGQIWVESEANKGSTFYFTLPLAGEMAIHSEEETSKETKADKSNASYTITGRIDSQSLSAKVTDEKVLDEISAELDEPSESQNNEVYEKNKDIRILIVDDEPVNRRVLSNHLISQGFKVSEAPDSPSALELLQGEEKIDLILLDVMMPKMSGYQACQEIRKTYGRHILPVIFITAKYQLEDIITGFEAGGNDFLSKPISRQELLTRVDLHLQLLQSTRNLEDKIQERTVELQSAYEQLEALSLSDPLTNLGNRRFFEKFIDSDASESIRKYTSWREVNDPNIPNESNLVFILIDIDHFKAVNDTYGHKAGDAVLVQVAQILKDSSRSSDYVVRWGGEEFMIVARFIRKDTAHILADRICRATAKHKFDIGEGKSISVTCSIGFACYPMHSEDPAYYSWEEVVNIADMCLYAVKASGRNGWIGALETEHHVKSLDEFKAMFSKDAVTIKGSMPSNKIDWN